MSYKVKPEYIKKLELRLKKIDKLKDERQINRINRSSDCK